MTIFYVLICIILFFIQERLLFFPENLSSDYAFQFQQNYQEIFLKTEDQISLSALHFTTSNPKGVIFFLHGNSGSLKRWGNVADVYTTLGGYNVFILDYRGYGKSQGEIQNLEQLYCDTQLAYDWLKTKYNEGEISIFGYSLGTGLATRIAATNYPKRLVLHAPYYSIQDMMHKRFPIIPNFILQYNINTAQFMKDVNCPVYIFHGNEDKVIPIEQSEKLKIEFPIKIQLTELNHQNHKEMVDNKDYQMKLAEIMLSN